MLQGSPALIADVLVVFGIVAVAVALFVTEAIPTDTTALAVLVSLVVLRGFTHVSAEDAVSGFASPATVTIVAMYILSAGVEETGVVERLEVAVARFTGGDRNRLLTVMVGITGPLAGVIAVHHGVRSALQSSLGPPPWDRLPERTEAMPRYLYKTRETCEPLP